MTPAPDLPARTLRRSEAVSRWFHGVLAVLVAGALLVDLGVILLGAPVTGPGGTVLSRGTRVVNYASYFTVQSNVLVAVVAASLALDPARTGRLWRVLRLDAVLAIVITGVVYALLLAGTNHPVGIGVVTNAVLHYVSPWATLLGWLVFGPRGRVSWRVLAAAFAWPVLWIAVTFAHGAATAWYPYFFLDVGTLGVGAALLHTVGILGVAGLLAVVLLGLDRILVAATGLRRAPAAGTGAEPDGGPPAGGLVIP